MIRGLLVIALAAATTPTCLGAVGRATPAQQVVNMLNEMKVKGMKMKSDEQTLFTTYKKWAKVESDKLGFEIAHGSRQIDELTAFITKTEIDVGALGEQIAELSAEIEKLSSQKAQATEIRSTQRKDFMANAHDLAESVEALKNAIQVLSAQNYDRAQAQALLQKMSTRMPGMPRVIAAFVQKAGQHQDGSGAPAVAAYESQTGGVLQMLEGLLEKFKGELEAAERAETNQAHAHSMLELHLSNAIASDKADHQEKSVLKGKKAAASAKAKGQLSEAKAEKAKDEELKAEIETTFESKKATFEMNQQVRAEEIETIAKAIEILSSPEVADSYAKHMRVSSLSQSTKVVGRSISLLQFGRSARQSSDVQRASAYLKERARALGSKTLAVAAAKVRGNPFDKVIGMIEGLIEKLQAAAAAEAEHKAWCDEQLKANKHKRKQKTTEINRLAADIEGLDSKITDLGGTISVLAREQAELAEAMKEATEFRQEEKAENVATIADAKLGFEAVSRALILIKEFYESQGSVSLLQQVPEMASYTGMQRAHNGVLGMLEVIQTDFGRLRTDTEASETAAASEYAKYMAESEATQKTKHEREFKLGLDKDQAEYERSETQKDLVATQGELDKANEYYSYLKPSCVEVHVNWEERVQQRKEEVAALTEAYAILDSKSPR